MTRRTSPSLVPLAPLNQRATWARKPTPHDMSTFWVRYFEPQGIPDVHKLEKWPDGMKGWISGHTGDGHIVWCARVDAVDADDAKRIVLSCYSKSASRIQFDFCEEKPLGWRPSGGRFPE